MVPDALSFFKISFRRERSAARSRKTWSWKFIEWSLSEKSLSLTSHCFASSRKCWFEAALQKHGQSRSRHTKILTARKLDIPASLRLDYCIGGMIAVNYFSRFSMNWVEKYVTIRHCDYTWNLKQYGRARDPVTFFWSNKLCQNAEVISNQDLTRRSEVASLIGCLI